jgi:hypothetical protein
MMVLRGNWGRWRTEEARRDADRRMREIERRQADLERFQRVLAAQVERLRRRIEGER